MTRMEKALNQIDMTFGPERKLVQDKITAMNRCAQMLGEERWADRAFTVVAKYNINNEVELVYAIIETISTEKDLVDHEFIVGSDLNVKSLNVSLDKVENIVFYA